MAFLRTEYHGHYAEVYNVALTADIEKAFLMIKVADEDQDALRFLWLEDVSSIIPRVNVLRFT